MSFSKDLFISYCHVDDEKRPGEDQGWVSRFKDELNYQLRQWLGRQVEIWQDKEKLTANQLFADEIMQELSQVALLVCIVSANYVSSEWCQKEATAFCDAATRSAGLEVRNKLRVFKVEKLPVQLTEQFPEILNKVLGARFYTSKEGVILPLDRAYGEEFKTAFNLEITRLAQQIVETLKDLRAASMVADQIKGKVYLAETSYDLNTPWKNLDSELRKRGYKIAPAFNLPSLEEGCIRDIGSGLAGCCLSIHMIGANPGMVPNGPGKKNVQILQNELAAQQASQSNLRRIVWLPRNTRSEDEAQQKFIDSMSSMQNMQLGAELVDGDFETLKETVLAALKKIESGQNSAAAAIPADAGNTVYIVCDKKDREAIASLQQRLKARGLHVKRPFFEGSPSAIRQQNEDLLREANAAVIFYGAGNPNWYVSSSRQVKKVNPGIPVWTYVAPEASMHKQEMLEQDDERSINGLDAELSARGIERLISVSSVRRAAAGGHSS